MGKKKKKGKEGRRRASETNLSAIRAFRIRKKGQEREEGYGPNLYPSLFWAAI